MINVSAGEDKELSYYPPESSEYPPMNDYYPSEYNPDIYEELFMIIMKVDIMKIDMVSHI